MSAVKIRTLLLVVLGQDEQDSGNDQLYTGSGDADTVQFNTTSSPTVTIIMFWFCPGISSGGPT